MVGLARFAFAFLAGTGLLAVGLHLAARRLGILRPLPMLRAAALAALLVCGIAVGTARTMAPTGGLAGMIPGARTGDGSSDAYDRALSDAMLQFLPWEIEVRRAIAERRVPVWSDRIAGGEDLWSNPQAQVASPIAWLARIAPFEQHLLAAFLFRVFVGFGGAALLARRLGFARPLALLSGAAFGLGGATLGFAVFPHGGAGALAPWLALAGLRAGRNRGPSGRATTALLAAGACLGGHPVTGLGSLLCAPLFGLSFRKRSIPRRAVLGALALPVLLGAALSAPWNVPFSMALLEAQGPAPPQVERQSPGESAALDATIPRTVVAALVEPFPDGRVGHPVGGRARAWLPAVSVYSGLWLVPGLIAAIFLRPARRCLPLLAFGMAILAASLVPSSWLAWKAALPVLRGLQIPRLAPAALLALIVVAAAGVSAGSDRRGRYLLALGLLLAGALGTLVGPRPATIAGLVLLASILWFSARAPRLALLLLLGTTACDFAIFLVRAIPRGDPGSFYPRSAWIDRLVELAGSGPAGRVAATGYRLYPSILSVYGAEELRPNNPPLVPANQAEVLEAGLGLERAARAYFAVLERPEHPLLDFLNVRYLVAGVDEPIPPGMRRLRGTRSGDHVVLRNNEAMPRWFFAFRSENVPRERLPEWIRGMRSAEVVALDPADGPWFAESRRAGGVGVRAREDGRIRLAVAAEPGPALLATSLPRWRGWSATAGERWLGTRRVNGAYLAVEIPPGVGEIELRYRPPGLVAGIVGAGLAIAVLAMLGLLDLVKARSRSAPVVQERG